MYVFFYKIVFIFEIREQKNSKAETLLFAIPGNSC